MKACTKCGKSYEATTKYFHKNKQSKDGLHPYCKRCRNLERKKYYSRKGRKLALRRYNEDPIYQMVFNLQDRGYKSMTREQLNEKLKEYAVNESRGEKTYLCGYCGRVMTEDGLTGGKRDFHIDHLVPYSLYKHVKEDIDPDLDNLVVACQFCNRSKSDLLFSEWYPKQAIAQRNILNKYTQIENEILRKLEEIR